MCGIAGIISSSGQITDSHREIVNSMKKKIQHRGPDSDDTLLLSGAVFGHQRLAIIDLDHGVQPFTSVDGRYVLVFNGEIYNYLELRQKLIQQGVHFKTFSDTEVLLHMLIMYKEKCLNDLLGMFAFVFYDTKTEEWLMARDQFGIKPLYYCRNQDQEIIFASEIKALLAHPDISAELNNKSLGHYLTFQFCLGNLTLFKDILKVEPGYYILGKGKTAEVPVKYWNLNFEIDHYSIWLVSHY
ncbi:MAG: hypothetical protein MK132_26970 [Lentisphaerales bacterium]|nr:hypothetical protein [Lentisphaerales bacterium]